MSSFGDWLGFIAVTSIVVGLGGSGSAGVAVAGVMVARTLPAFVFGPIAGAFVDRLDRKQLMIASDLGRGVLYVSMAFLHQLWAIYMLSFVDRVPVVAVDARRATRRCRTSCRAGSSRTRTRWSS